MNISKILIYIGLATLIFGILLAFLNKPTGIEPHKEKIVVYFPIVASIILSVILTVVINVIIWIMRK